MSSIAAAGSTSTFPKQRNGSALGGDDAHVEERVTRLPRRHVRDRRRRPSRGRRTARTGSRPTTLGRGEQRDARLSRIVSRDPSRSGSRHFCPEFTQSVPCSIPRASCRHTADGMDEDVHRDADLEPTRRRACVGRRRRRGPRGRRPGLRRGACGLERDDRPPSRRDRPVPHDGRRGRGGHVRPGRTASPSRSAAAATTSPATPCPTAAVMVDLSPMHGVRVDPERARAFGRGRRHLGRRRRATQEFGLATPGGPDLGHRRRRADAERRDRLAARPVRPGDRQPRVGGGRHRRRPRRCARARPRTRTCSGRSAAAAATSASSPSSSSPCTRSGRP